MSTDRRIAITLAALLLLVGVLAVLSSHSGRGEAPTQAAVDPTVWSCVNEDASGQPDGQWPCLWDAGRMGNGVGKSLLYLGPDAAPMTVEMTP
jgi:hypothetical protein